MENKEIERKIIVECTVTEQEFENTIKINNVSAYDMVGSLATIADNMAVMIAEKITNDEEYEKEKLEKKIYINSMQCFIADSLCRISDGKEELIKNVEKCYAAAIFAMNGD